MKVCTVEGCDRPQKGRREWCAMHVERWRRWGDPTETRRRVRTVCSVDGCERFNEANGLCPLHYRRLRQRGDINPAPLPRAEGAGYATGSDSPVAVQIAPETVAAIRAAYKPSVKGRGQHALAQQFGLSRSTVQRIVTETDRWAETA